MTGPIHRAPAERRRLILHSLNRTEPTSVEALARLTGASAVTIRRDLAELASHELVRRVHGGACLPAHRGARYPYSERAEEDLESKRVLARATAARVADGESLILDTGSTCELIAQLLAGRDLTVLALSLRTASVLAQVPGTRVSIPGGTVETETLSLLSVMSLDALRQFRADTAVLGACAASPTWGLCSTQSEDAAVKRAIMASASRVLLPTTSRKLTRTSAYRFGGVEDVTEILVTSDAPEAALDGLRAAGVVVSVCS
ncbi:DeoR/GlpR family DNA-binding transcription regulator [Actinomyces howellii]|uniref:Lactose phosphotransferase system repressor n=1 Tax=Actinomyces howellii TaxID=52771 RepID=A0A3S4R588_9ACTO|nr:DeoR/GlpR family DNA-binding transcription regulator [Actinomyces howellii]VEG30091.1 Glycerol-3-phosphate regulon repressor [Actinomyces howellii]